MPETQLASQALLRNAKSRLRASSCRVRDDQRSVDRNPPQLPRNKFAVPGEEILRPRLLVHIQRFAIGIIWARGDVMQLEIGERGHPDNIVLWLQARRRQFITGEIDDERRRFSDAQVRQGAVSVVGIGLGVNPSSVVQRKRGNVAS